MATHPGGLVHVIVGGCGRLGAEIATQLSGKGDDVVIIDIDDLAFDRLGGAFNGETIVGNVTDREILERAGIQHADGLTAVTRFDNANLMSVEIAVHLYGVEHAVARLFNPERESSYRKLGVRYVSSTGLQAKQFLNLLREGTYRQHVAFDQGDVEVVEFTLAEAADGMTVERLEQDGKLRVCAVERRDRVFIPNPRTRLESGDLVVAAARRGVHRTLRDVIEPEGRPRLPDPDRSA